MNKKLKLLMYAGILGMALPVYAQNAAPASDAKNAPAANTGNTLNSWEGYKNTGGKLYIEWDKGYVDYDHTPKGAGERWNEYGYGSGKIYVDKEGSFVFENTGERDIGGVNQIVYLNQQVPKPIYFSAESKAENVQGTEADGYSIYLDIYYSDGTVSHGVTKNFAPGSHDWEKVSAEFTPKKPIKSVIYYLILRYHTGKASFKNAVLKE